MTAASPSLSRSTDLPTAESVSAGLNQPRYGRDVFVPLRFFTYVRLVSAVVYVLGFIPGITLNRLLLFGLGILAEVVAALFLTLALRRLSKMDPAFNRASRMVMLFLIGGPALFLGGLLIALDQSITVIGTTTYSTLNVGELGTGFIIFMIGAVFGIAGLVGAVLGLWRLGNQIGKTAVKIGALLYPIPYLNVASDFLLFIGIGIGRQRH